MKITYMQASQIETIYNNNLGDHFSERTNEDIRKILDILQITYQIRRNEKMWIEVYEDDNQT